jgi:hypothetical protein
VKIAVAISGVEGFDLRSYQEIALSGIEHSVAEYCMTHSIDSMKWRRRDS